MADIKKFHDRSSAVMSRDHSVSAGSTRSIDPPPSTPRSSISSISTARSQRTKWLRYSAFVFAITSCLSAGSILLYSLYAPIFQKTLHYSQLQVNAISIAGELGMYLPVPLFGYICDSYGPSRLSLISTLFFTPGYLLAAYAFTHRLQYNVMVAAFLLVGAGTSSMYLSAVTTCAKNFTKKRGLALALPIAAFGLSSLWMSQLATGVFYLRDGTVGDSGGREVDVARLFVFFAILLVCVGSLGGLTLHVYPDDASELVQHGEAAPLLAEGPPPHYGDEIAPVSPILQTTSTNTRKPILNAQTRAFLTDHTMWYFAAGIFLVTGPGEAFINNMGTLLHSIERRDSFSTTYRNDPAFHVSVIALTSTVARLVSGVLSDYAAPPATPAHPHMDEVRPKRWLPYISRIWMALFFAAVMIVAHFLLATGFIQKHPSVFWIISASLGSGYGAIFTISPTVVSVVWGVENFGVNYGIVTMVPAFGATAYGMLFAGVYDREMGRQVGGGGLCEGGGCYEASFWVMGWSVVVACALWVWAWKGKGGWRERGIAV